MFSQLHCGLTKVSEVKYNLFRLSIITIRHWLKTLLWSLYTVKYTLYIHIKKQSFSNKYETHQQLLESSLSMQYLEYCNTPVVGLMLNTFVVTSPVCLLRGQYKYSLYENKCTWTSLKASLNLSIIYKCKIEP